MQVLSIVRGGSWCNLLHRCRVGNRLMSYSANRSYGFGFRVVVKRKL